MKSLAQIVLLIAVAGPVSSFTVNPLVKRISRPAPLCMAESRTSWRDTTAGSGMQLQHVQTLIDKLNKDNYVVSLEMIEPFLVNEANTDLYEQSMKRIYHKAHNMGLPIPDNYAQDPSRPPFSLHGDDSLDKTAGSGMQLQHVELLISHLSDDNFDVSLEMIEPFLLNEASPATLQRSVEEIKQKAEKLGKEVPESFAKRP
jgi:hypothetical protein